MPILGGAADGALCQCRALGVREDELVTALLPLIREVLKIMHDHPYYSRGCLRLLLLCKSSFPLLRVSTGWNVSSWGAPGLESDARPHKSQPPHVASPSICGGLCVPPRCQANGFAFARCVAAGRTYAVAWLFI